MIHPLPEEIVDNPDGSDRPTNLSRAIDRELKQFEKDAETIMNKLLGGIFGRRN